MDDDLDPKEEGGVEDTEDEFGDHFDDDLILGKKKSSKRPHDDDSIESLETLAGEEDGILPEDSYDDEDLW